jgi:hypothetical protein
MTKMIEFGGFAEHMVHELSELESVSLLSYRVGNKYTTQNLNSPLVAA